MPGPRLQQRGVNASPIVTPSSGSDLGGLAAVGSVVLQGAALYQKRDAEEKKAEAARVQNKVLSNLSSSLLDIQVAGEQSKLSTQAIGVRSMAVVKEYVDSHPDLAPLIMEQSRAIYSNPIFTEVQEDKEATEAFQREQVEAETEAMSKIGLTRGNETDDRAYQRILKAKRDADFIANRNVVSEYEGKITVANRTEEAYAQNDYDVSVLRNTLKTRVPSDTAELANFTIEKRVDLGKQLEAEKIRAVSDLERKLRQQNISKEDITVLKNSISSEYDIAIGALSSDAIKGEYDSQVKLRDNLAELIIAGTPQAQAARTIFTEAGKFDANSVGGKHVSEFMLGIANASEKSVGEVFASGIGLSLQNITTPTSPGATLSLDKNNRTLIVEESNKLLAKMGGEESLTSEQEDLMAKIWGNVSIDQATAADQFYAETLHTSVRLIATGQLDGLLNLKSFQKEKEHGLRMSEAVMREGFRSLESNVTSKVDSGFEIGLDEGGAVVLTPYDTEASQEALVKFNKYKPLLSDSIKAISVLTGVSSEDVLKTFISKSDSKLVHAGLQTKVRSEGDVNPLLEDFQNGLEELSSFINTSLGK